ncbi:MAG TPA: glycosyltransferase [Ignavibacteria bacterium]|nr:glycosyltransferase [Ignavibacteria bacterium]HMQ98042.1 glycosyltransferase [Ignavibacteria bacterium]
MSYELGKEPLVSVIIPTYNRAHILGETLHSILKQDYRNIEIIIIDDGSTDGTATCVSEFNTELIRYHNVGKLADIAKLRNIGISHATGDVIAFCDDDDLWISNKLSSQLPYLKFYDMICSNAAQIDYSGIVVNTPMIDGKVESKCLDTITLLHSNYVITSSVIIKRSSLHELFVERKSTYSAEDYELWIKLSLSIKIYYLNERLVLFRKHENTTSFDRSRMHSKLLNQVILRLKEYVKNENAEIRNNAKISIIRQRRELTKVYFKNSHFGQLLKESLKILAGVLSYNFLKYYVKTNFLTKTLFVF